jgi:hypothetical protein
MSTKALRRQHARPFNVHSSGHAARRHTSNDISTIYMSGEVMDPPTLMMSQRQLELKLLLSTSLHGVHPPATSPWPPTFQNKSQGPQIELLDVWRLGNYRQKEQDIL